MRNLFVKGLFAASAVMMLASCNNEEGMDIQNGATTKVAVGVSVLTPESKAYTGDQLNQGATVQTISNVTIVPMVAGAYQTPIVIGDVTSSETTGKYVEATIRQDVDQFRVYGNVDATILGGIQTGNITIAAAVSEENGDMAYSETLYAPYGLYYYADATTFKVATDEANNWDVVTSWTDAQKVGTNNRVKIENVSYKVGVVAAGVMLDETTINENACFGEEESGKTWADISSTGMDLKGLVIYNQPESFNAAFTQTGDVRVFAGVTNTNLQADKLVFGEGNKIAGANIYSTVAQEDGASVVVSFQFQNNTGGILRLNDGTQAANGAYVYYSTTLQPRDGLKIFDEGYTTLLNATITDWGKGTTTLPLETDVQIGVTIDTSWAQGILFDQTI